jgi:hypothetical protein
MRHGVGAIAAGVVLLAAGVVAAADVGRVKVAQGQVAIERGGQRLPATVGMMVQEGDVLMTGPDGAAGVTFADDTMLSVGPATELAIDRFAFDTTTHAGRFDASLRHGTLSAVSGKIARQSADAMKVRTPSTILGVRGTEFAVHAAPIAP